MNKIIFTISTILIFSIVPISAREDISSNVKNIQYTYKSQDNLTNLLQLSVLNFFRIKFIFDSIRWTINIK